VYVIIQSLDQNIRLEDVTCLSGTNTTIGTIGCNIFMLLKLLTPWSRVLLEKLTVNFAASQEIPRIYGTRKFLTVPTSPIQSPRPPPTF
jgi:hypothetical protein